jgi:5'-3' exonuclease
MQNTALNPLVDADFIIYRVGFAVKDDEPLEFALSTVKSVINNIKDRFPEAQSHRLFLTGKGNFRDKVATLQIYKGNRDPSHKPKYYTEIKEYMIQHHDAEVVQGMEAEDACGIEQYAAKNRDTVIVGVDKDLLTIPGWHYNPVKDTMTYVTLPEANEYFWKQVLTGDRTDNIRGIDGLGPKTADKLIAPCNRDWNKMREVVLEQYKKQHGNDAEAIMDETARLVFILRKAGETYDGSPIQT